MRNKGLKGQSSLDPLKIGNGEHILPISTKADGFLYSTLTMLVNSVPNPIVLRTDRKGGPRSSLHLVTGER